MAKKNLSNPAKHSTPAMSPTHPHTVGVVANSLSSDADADQEDDYVCPVCESECTCRNRQAVSADVPPPHATLSSPVPAHVAVPTPKIKIKLTVPPSMRLSSSSSQLAFRKQSRPAHDGGRNTPTAASPYGQSSHLAGPSTGGVHLGVDASAPKRRGRPPKHVVAAREAARAAMAATQPHAGGSGFASSLVSKRSKATATGRKPALGGNKALKARNTTGITARKTIPKTIKRKAAPRPAAVSDDEETDSDIQSAQFPTFMSASAVSSSPESSSEDDSDSDDSSPLTDGFESDSSIQAEEENYLIQQSYRTHDKARVKRELLGDDPTSRRHGNGDWEIKSRKRSVGPSDGEMEVDSTDDDSDSETAGEEEADGEEEEDEGENDGDADEEEDGFRVGSGYTGVATSWSDSEESNFDADLFFSNLTSDSESSTHQELTGTMSDGDETESDVDMGTMSLATVAAAGFSSMFGGSDLFRLDGGLALEVAGEWGDHPKDGQSLSGTVWEWDLGGENGSLSGGGEEVDEEMRDGEDSLQGSPTMSVANDGYDDYNMGVELRESDGETTDDDFVGEDGLPTQRAMLLFRWPTPPPAPAKLSAIDPRHTVSPERGQRDLEKSSGQRDSPRPADILAGRGGMYWSPEEEDEHDSPRGRTGSVSVHSDSRMPIMGRFEAKPVESQKVTGIAIINGQNPAVPSPYPRRKKSVSTAAMDSPGVPQTPGPAGSSAQPTEEFLTDSTLPGDDRGASAVTIDLSDVLDDSFLNSDQCMEDDDASMSSAASDDESRHLRNLSRWERIPMDTFRQTRTASNAIPSSDVEPVSAGAVTDSPFGNTLLWPHAGKQAAGPSRGPTRKSVKPVGSKSSKRQMSVVISPVILPVRDGDRTPTQAHGEQLPTAPYHQGKTRKELRKEKKMKRKQMSKTYSPPHHNHSSQLKYRHHHQHHPNQKSRGSNAVQRTNFFNSPGSSIPPLNI
ncbi:hypothetical protein GLOTRDRAFT_138143 [Gloeophyllum trabeum ATCC 11539]|uniref:Uncharacterized protein n=1 Tax=Gloeophyllum trabeum (strain ATCC 11539 / FP-39264 / Madison 617) TaxID=670483 RepID=S7QA66_GLOTA|nr:uncharacterized protein GLOTRDRAFT_138143 [Gloeophyllum trabeum ATCC 11539]EPQ56407.1 hypothetical protein GLOTRDRAFT_138143 [Gloeophyllum trabeum ATCC 11539]